MERSGIQELLGMDEGNCFILGSMNDEQRGFYITDARKVIEVIPGQKRVFGQDTKGAGEGGFEDESAKGVLCCQTGSGPASEGAPVEDRIAASPFKLGM